MTTRTGEPERVYHYTVDREGNLWHDGSVIEDDPFWTVLLRGVRRDGQGRDVALCQGESCYLHPEDTIFVVKALDLVPGPSGLERITLRCQGRYRETLDPATLEVGAGNVLYCRVREGAYRARFSRPAYWELTKHIAHDSRTGRFFLPLGGKRFEIAGA